MRWILGLCLFFSLACASAPLPKCDYLSLETAYQAYGDWQKSLLDPLFKLNESYHPPDLVSVSQAGLDGDYLVRKIVIEDLAALIADAASSGADLEIQSAYRSYDYQAATFQYWVDREGREAALKSSARAGHSEHQLGTVLDFRSKGGVPPWELNDWAATPAGGWLAENAWRYGFIMSYPKGKEAESCYIYEPWHYRYVGKETAKRIRDSGLTLREWLWTEQ